MSKDLVQIGVAEPKYSVRGNVLGYKVSLYHKGLSQYQSISAPDEQSLKEKIHNQMLKWDVSWANEEKKKALIRVEWLADQETNKAKQRLQEIEGLLSHTLSIDDAIKWDDLKKNDDFKLDMPDKEFIRYREDGYPIHCVEYKQKPPINKAEYQKPYQPAYSWFDKITMMIVGKAKHLANEAEFKVKQEQAYEKAVQDRQQENVELLKRNELYQAEFESLKNYWEAEKEKFEESKAKFNQEIEAKRALYESKNQEVVVEYCEQVLENSVYPDSLPSSFDIQYNETNQMLLVEYRLPSIRDIPNVNHVRYVKARNEIETKYLSESQHSKLYDSAIYQIVLRTIHELCEADKANAIDTINLNGIVHDINPSTGHMERNCIVSIQVRKADFEQINLASIDPKQCFKSLKGVGSSKLSTMTAIKPILELNKSDKRFVGHYDVASGLSDEINLASIDWQDFEHLIRELFEKEFASNGGEVKVTQASSDGGVDAVAFDPDPIRGGKIVIQAKRYTNTVGVSAVRDLYGTVMNEGATKGILVTTSDYGSDSYEFAKNKPITLLNGGHLLHLLEKHGHRAKIDLKEAKKLAKSA